MIKYYCDWCRNETTNPHGGTFGRRVAVAINDSPDRVMNVLFQFEFSMTSKPEHLCLKCYVSKLREAVDWLEHQRENT